MTENGRRYFKATNMPQKQAEIFSRLKREKLWRRLIRRIKRVFSFQISSGT